MALVGLMAVVALLAGAGAVDTKVVGRRTSGRNISCMLVFGDSTVDPGNNNWLPTTFRANFPPYGRDFNGGRPSGRFTNGRLPTDFIAGDLGFESFVPGFLERDLPKEALLHGVSFASAAAGYDDLTANISSVLPFSRQIEYLMHYKVQLRTMVGARRAAEIVRDAVFVLSAGTNDFIQNYFLTPTRPKQYTVDEYVDYLLTCMATDIKKMHRVGGSRFVVIGMPPVGCLPLAKTMQDVSTCVAPMNQAAQAFNTKLKAQLSMLETTLGIQALYGDTYSVLMEAITTPKHYGFTISSKGCCGSGLVEFGELCEGQKTCADVGQYVFWDAVHPTEKMYRLISNELERTVVKHLLL